MKEESKKTIHIYLKLDDNEKKLLNKLAALTTHKKATLARIIIENFLRKNKDLIENLENKKNAELLLKKLFIDKEI